MRKLRQDFEKLRLLIDLVKKREILKRDYVNVLEDAFHLESMNSLKNGRLNHGDDDDKLTNERRRQIKMQTQQRQRTQKQAAKLLVKAKLEINHKTKNGKNGQVHVSLATLSTNPPSNSKQKSMLSRISRKKQPLKIKSKRKVHRTR